MPGSTLWITISKDVVEKMTCELDSIKRRIWVDIKLKDGDVVVTLTDDIVEEMCRMIKSLRECGRHE